MSTQRASRLEKTAGEKGTLQGLRFAGERYRERIPRQLKKKEPDWAKLRERGVIEKCSCGRAGGAAIRSPRAKRPKVPGETSLITV